MQGGRKVSEKRGITLLASQQWAAVQQDLKDKHSNLPWTARRANVLLDVAAIADLNLPIPPSVKPPLPDRQDAANTDPFTLLGLIGRQLKIGTALLEVTVETKPCSHIDRLTPGLRKALLPDGRGGVCCRVIENGAIATGDPATLLQ